MQQTTKLEGLQALRAGAALAVMLFHGTRLLDERLGVDLGVGFFTPGFHGVDVFFVLSGFIIHYTAGRHAGRGEFLWRRAVRLLPVYWIVTALLVVVWLVAPTPGMEHKGDPGVVLRSFLLVPQPRHVVGVAWTLVYELWFYGLFGLLWFRRPLWLYVGLAAWSLFDPIVVEFLLGCGVAALFSRTAGRGAVPALALGAAGLAAAWWATIAGQAPARELALGLPSALLVYGLAGWRVRPPRPLTWLGDASYSIYLVHATAISAAIQAVVVLGLAPAFSNVWGGVAVLAAALAGSCAFYQWVERPLLAACRRHGPAFGTAGPGLRAAASSG